VKEQMQLKEENKMAESQDSQIPWNDETRIACAFSFKCSKTWDQLGEGDNPTICYCLYYEREVLLVQTEADFRRYGEQDRCIAVPVAPSDNTGESKMMLGTTGVPTPEQEAEAQRVGREWLAQYQK
jgi:hypothetical protein